MSSSKYSVRLLAIAEQDLQEIVSYVAVTPDQARESMGQARMPSWMIEAMLELYGAVRAGHLSVVFKDYEQVMGKKPTAFAEFVRDYKPQLM